MEKQIEEMAKELQELANIVVQTDFDYWGLCWQKGVGKCPYEEAMNCQACTTAKNILDAGYRKGDEGSVVLTTEEYEKMKSLYDCQQGAIMTSSIGDLPLTVEGLRKAVDEITSLNRVEIELQELNAKYYNEAKDLRRELKEIRKETAKEILRELKERVNAIPHPYFNSYETLCEIDKLAKQYGVELD